MIGITTARSVVLRTHLAPLIFLLLISITLLSALLAGYTMSKRKSRSWLHILVFAGAISLTVFAVLNLEYQRFGLVRLDAADNALTQLRKSTQ